LLSGLFWGAAASVLALVVASELAVRHQISHGPAAENVSLPGGTAFDSRRDDAPPVAPAARSEALGEAAESPVALPGAAPDSGAAAAAAGAEALAGRPDAVIGVSEPEDVAPDGGAVAAPRTGVDVAPDGAGEAPAPASPSGDSVPTVEGPAQPPVSAPARSEGAEAPSAPTAPEAGAVLVGSADNPVQAGALSAPSDAVPSADPAPETASARPAAQTDASAPAAPDGDALAVAAGTGDSPAVAPDAAAAVDLAAPDVAPALTDTAAPAPAAEPDVVPRATDLAAPALATPDTPAAPEVDGGSQIAALAPTPAAPAAPAPGLAPAAISGPGAPDAAGGALPRIFGPAAPGDAPDAGPAPAAPAAPDTDIAAAPRPSGLPSGQLPQIGDAPTAPAAPRDPAAPAAALVRNAVAFDNPDAKAMVAVVLIADAGPPVELPFPVTLAFSQSLPDAARQIDGARGRGQEVVVIPAMPEGAAATDVAQSLRAGADLLFRAVAVMDNPQGRLDLSGGALDELIAEIRQSGHGLVTYPHGSGFNMPLQVARREGAVASVFFRDIDAAGQSAVVVKRFLDNAVSNARRLGSVIVLARNRPETIQALAEFALVSRESNVVFAPLSAVLRASVKR